VVSEASAGAAPDGATAEVTAPAAGEAGFDSSAELAQLRAQVGELEKKNQFLSEGFVAARRPAWTAEVQRLHPELAALVGKEGFAGIQATSRRSFLRAAEALAEAHAPSIAALKSMKEQASTAVEDARLAAADAARQEVIEAWGRPAADSISPPARDAKSEKDEIVRRLSQ
jgi:hypothetical protein